MSLAILSLFHKLYGLDGKHVEIMMANKNRIQCEVEEITASAILMNIIL